MNDLVLALKLTTQGGQLVVKDLSAVTQASRNADQAISQLGQAGGIAASGIGKTSQQSKELAGEVKRTATELDTMHGRMLALAGGSAVLFAALQSFGGVTALIQRADDFNVLQQRIRTATAETNDYNVVSAEMYAIAQRNGAALGSTVELFQRLSTSRKDLKATNEQMLEFTDGVQKLGVIGGSSTQALEAGLMQLAQGLSGGVLRAEEFNSILENIPELASRIGKGMDDIGKSENELGLGDLRKLVLEGKLLSDDVLKSILVQLPEIEKQFAKMPISVGRAGVMIDNSFSSALSRLDSITGATQAWADVLVSISKTFDDMSASELQNATATLLALAGAGAALLLLTRYNIGIKSITVSSVGMTATILQKTAALLGVAGSAGVATGQITALGIASAATSRAMALLGGPVGLAVLAGLAIYQFASNSDLGAEKADLLADRLSKLSGAYDDVSKTKIQDAVASNTKELATNAERIVEITRKISENRKAVEFNPASNAAKAAYRELGTLKQELAALNATQKVLMDDSVKLGQLFFDFSAATDPYAESAAKASDELLKLYNTQMLNAQAIDAQGRALSGVDLELFKSTFKDAATLPKDAETAIKQFFKTAEASQQLAANDKYLTGLKEEVRLQQVRLSQGEAEYELQKAISSQKLADPKQLKLLQDTLALQRQINQTKSQGDALKALKAENDLLQIRLTKGEKEYQLQKVIRDLKVTDPAVIKQLDAEIERQRLLNEQLDVRKYLTDGSYDEVLDGLTKIGDAGSSVGNALVDSFGSVADQFARMAEQQDDFTKKFITLSEARQKAEKEVDPAKRTKALQKANSTESRLLEDQTRMQMGSYANLAGAASKMFSEQSKGRQVMHKLEVTFAAIETALALKKAAANAIAAITNQGSGDPYSAFARIAAMAAIMAGLGVFSGSASGSGVSAESRQRSQGTGTSLGDSAEKSDSIANALGRIEDLELDQYAALRAINSSIRELSAGIKNLAVTLVANYGRFNEANYGGDLGKQYNLQLGSGLASVVGGGLYGLIADQLLDGLVGGITNRLLGGFFGSKKTTLLDSGISFASQQLGDILSTGLVNATVYDVIQTTKKKLFGLSKSSSESTEYRAMDDAVKAEFGRIFTHMGKSVTEAVKVLGLETSKSLESFVINLPNVSFKDLSGDEIEKELQAIFSQQGDLMVQYLLPGLAAFQQMGEGLYETLIRVAQEQAVFNAALDNLGLQLGRFAGVTKAIELEVAQSIIELIGGIEKFQDATSTYFSEFYSEAQQQAALTKMLSAQFASLGMTLPATRDGLTAIIDGLDLTTDAGQKMFAALMGLIDGLDQFYDAAEAAKKAAEQAAEQERKLAAERTKYDASVSNELARMGMSPLQIALDDINKWYADATAEAKALGADTSLLSALYDKKREALATQYVTKSIQSAEAAMTALVTDYQRTVEQLGQTLASMLDSISGMADSIAGDILNIRKTLPEFSAVGYYDAEVSSLSNQLGSGSAAAQLDIVGKIKAAMLERYNAELAAIDTNMAALQAEQDAKRALYDLQRAQFEALKDAALSLKNAAASLVTGDLSTLTTGERLAQLQSQYNSAVGKARGGDAEAYSQVQSLGEQLLQMSRNYNPANYSGVFDSVLAVFNELSAQTFTAPTEPAPHPAVAAADAEKIQLARQTITQLQALTTRTESLNAVANAEYTAAVNALKAQFSIDATSISTTLAAELAATRLVMPAQTDRVVALLQQQIDAIHQMRAGIVGAIDVIPRPVPIDLTPIVGPIDKIWPKLDLIWEPLPVLPPLMESIYRASTNTSSNVLSLQSQLVSVNDQLALSNRAMAANESAIHSLKTAQLSIGSMPLMPAPDFSAVVTQLVGVNDRLALGNRAMAANESAIHSLKTAQLSIGSMPLMPAPDFSAVVSQLLSVNEQLALGNRAMAANESAIHSLKTAQLSIGSMPQMPAPDFSAVVAQLQVQTALLSSSQASMAQIAQANDVAKPIIIPPTSVVVNVEMVPVVTELRVMQRQQQQQLDQQALHANETNQKLGQMVDANKKLQQELAEFASQAMSLARVS